MKKSLLFAALIAMTLPMSAQHYNYIVTKGKNTSSASWDLSQEKDHYSLTVTAENHTSYQKIDFSGRTTEWRRVCKDEDTDFTVKYQYGSYVISGKKDGKVINKTQESKYPWYQNIQFSAPLIMQVKEGNNVTYENVNPKDCKIYTMTATFGSKSKIGKHEVYELHCASSGIFSNIWNSFYYIDAKTNKFVSYNAVEGVPGTPRTTWLLEE